MIRFCLSALLVLGVSISSGAQIGNEWIQFNQSYFKIPVAKEGLYRVNYNTLQQAGFPLAGDPRNIQLFHRGVQQAIFIQGEGDGTFNNTDYVEFYGFANDGIVDRDLYVVPGAQPHAYYNLFSDTTAYFLTLGVQSGKRMALTSDVVGTESHTHHVDEKLIVLRDQYFAGANYGENQLTAFDYGEGWTGSRILKGEEALYQVSGIINRHENAGLPTLELLMTGHGPMEHAVDVFVGTRLLSTVTFSGFNSTVFSSMIAWTDITADGRLPVRVHVIGVGANDRISVGYIKVRYPQQLIVSGASLKSVICPPHESAGRKMNFSDGNTGYRIFDATDRNNVKRIPTTNENGLTVLMSSAANERKIKITNAVEPATVSRVRFRQMSTTAANYIIISHPHLRKPASGYTDPVKAYAEYRSLPAGGGYDTMVVDITQLYDQFTYGEPTPLAIHRFIRYLDTGDLPDYLFLIGKGLDIYYNYRRAPGNYPGFKDLIPPAGYPASDMHFSAAPNGPSVPTGRLSAMHPHDVAAYLNKVKAREALPYSDLRRKNILHLSGGIYEGEPQRFRSYLENFAEIAKGPLFGGNVLALAKQSRDSDVINVSEEVNKGVNLVTFFGHSASTSTDFDIGNVTDPVLGYNNKDGKFPVLLMNGCYAGSYFLNTVIFGENWILTPNRGAIGVIAHTYLASEPGLQRYANLFYHVAFQNPDFVNKGLGDIQKEVAHRYLATFGTAAPSITHSQQMVLLGDPAIRLFAADQPDYSIRQSSVQLKSQDGESITALTDTLILEFVVDNFGRAADTQLKISVSRELSNQNLLEYDTIIPAIAYSGIVQFKIPSRVPNGQGENRFHVEVDPENDYAELNKDNNTYTLDYFIPLSGTQNLYPNDYAIVTTRSIHLTLQHSDPLSDERAFMVEIDTIPTFTSQYKQQFLLDKTVLVSQPVELLEKDSTTYYWRSRLNDAGPNESADWTVSSFSYIENGQTGWAQLDFAQLQQNQTDFLVFDEAASKMEFSEMVTPVSVKTFSSLFNYPKDSVSFKLQGVEYNLNLQNDNILSCRDNTINLVAMDRESTQPYAGVFLNWIQLGQLGNRSIICGRDPFVINSYKSDEVVMANDFDLLHYVDNVAMGDSVMLFNIGNAGFSAWPESVKEKLGALGISVAQINSLQDGDPVVIRGRKGSAPGTAAIYTGSISGTQTKVQYAGTITGRAKEAQIETKPIGPAQAWSNLALRYSKQEYDSVSVDVVGITAEGLQTTLASKVEGDLDLSFVDANTYPHLKLIFRTMDSVFVTSPQLRKWLVTFEAVPEGVLLYSDRMEPQSVNEGEVLHVNYRFVNVSTSAFSSPTLDVEYTIRNSGTMDFTTGSLTINAPLPEDTTKFVVSFPSVQQDGLNSLDVFVNRYDSPELHYHNNQLGLNNFLTVITDTSDPVLDVTFDGKHIAGGEFVSSSPTIGITLWDDNPYLLTTDTTNIEIYLAHPCDESEPSECPFAPVYFKNGPLTWTPETTTEEFAVVYSPTLSAGIYTLRIVARDANGNTAGSQPYEKQFQVGTEPAVIMSDAHPNPFSHKANFDFVLTTDATVESFSLVITNLAGRTVHRFTETDVDGFHVGRNSLSWTATDEAGIPLPPGLYAFRIQMIVAGKEYAQQGKVILVR